MKTPTARPTSLLFVCLGNICRSPLAEGVFRYLVAGAETQSRYRADSAGTGGWHAGEAPDPRSVAVAHRHGIPLEGAARKVEHADFDDFDLILAMDADNLRELQRMRPSAGRARIHLLRDFDPQADPGSEVPDPYYGAPGGFEEVFEMVHRSCRGLLQALEDGSLR